MVKGLKIITDSEILLSVTGVAGPSGGTLRTPVGCVFLALVQKLIRNIHLKLQKKYFMKKQDMLFKKRVQNMRCI